MIFAVLTGLIIIGVLVGVVYLAVKSLDNRVVSGQEGMLGEPGEAASDFVDGKGQVRAHGEIWAAFSEDDIRKGDALVVTGLERLMLKVKKPEE